MQAALVDHELWELIQPLLPRRTRRYGHPGPQEARRPMRFERILFALTTGIAWRRCRVSSASAPA